MKFFRLYNPELQRIADHAFSKSHAIGDRISNCGGYTPSESLYGSSGLNSLALALSAAQKD
jgi:hypothetical protein